MATYNADLTMTKLNIKQKGNIILPTRLRIGEADSTDREAWVEEAKRFGMARFQEGEGDKKFRKEETSNLRPRANGKGATSSTDYSTQDNVDPAGKRRRTEDQPNILFWEALRARAEMKEGTAPGINGLTTSMYKYIPVTMIPDVVDLFQQRMEGKQ